MIDSPAYDLASFLTRIISPSLGKTEYVVANSSEFVQLIRDKEVDTSDILVSFDVTQLFTRVPVNDAVEAVCKKLDSDLTFSDRTDLSIGTIKELMLSCLECRYFQFQGDFYEQLHGAPMGLSLSVVLANCYMEVLEENVLRSAPKKPAIWKRYVDDVFVLWEHGEEQLNEFHRLINGWLLPRHHLHCGEGGEWLPALLGRHDQKTLRATSHQRVPQANLLQRLHPI